MSMLRMQETGGGSRLRGVHHVEGAKQPRGNLNPMRLIVRAIGVTS